MWKRRNPQTKEKAGQVKEKQQRKYKLKLSQSSSWKEKSLKSFFSRTVPRTLSARELDDSQSLMLF